MKPKRINKGILEKEASSFRQHWGPNNSDPIALKPLLIKMGVLALFRPMSQSFSGMALKIIYGEETFRFMMVNSNMSLGHQNFTICHELYHLYIQKSFESQICTVETFQQKDPEEYNADVFAAYLLTPSEAIKANVPNSEIEQGCITLGTVVKIENLLSCSRLSLLIRLKQLNLISERYFNEFQHSVKASARQFGYGPYLYEPSPCDSVVGDYGMLANELFNKDIISEHHFYSLMEELGFSIESLELLDDED